LLVLGDANYNLVNQLLNSILGKFIALGLVWSFSFQMLSEVRHLIMDMGYGFELQTTRISGLIVIFGSFLLTILIYLIGKNFI
ncbi:succinate dehydrogenase, cytochrome b556 subunit, partial [Candidatus Pelagibacter sp.]|nr:succinate dehydrogenase, cytochrome b556 subunit [Candidatus Pelagibacter sp.]